GSSLGHAGRRVERCCTSLPRRPSMRATRTCFAKRSTVPRQWDDRPAYVYTLHRCVTLVSMSTEKSALQPPMQWDAWGDPAKKRVLSDAVIALMSAFLGGTASM